MLDRVAPGPLVTPSRAVAVAMVHGPKAGLALRAVRLHSPRESHRRMRVAHGWKEDDMTKQQEKGKQKTAKSRSARADWRS